MNMRYLISAAALAIAAPVAAQDTTTNTTNSNAGAVSGSLSGAESNGNQQGQSQANIGGNNAGIGSSRNDLSSTSTSGAIANTASESASRSNSDQTQGQGQSSSTDQTQGQSANNSQSQGQTANNGQTQGLTNSNTLGQTAANNQGVTVNQTWNSTNRKRTEVWTNNAVPLAASSSFSSDYCGGTASGGASAAPLGISIGGSGPTFDKSCQSLRRAEKFGMAAANASNMGYPELAGRLMSMMIWSICTSDSKGPKADASTAEACAKVLPMGDAPQAAGVMSVPVPPVHAPVTPMESAKPNVQPLPNDYVPYENLKTPRGDAGTPSPLASAAH